MTNETTINKKSILDMRVVDFINDLLFAVFIFNTVLLPNDTFNLKIVSLGALLLFNLPYILKNNGVDKKVVFWGGLVLPSVLILWSIFLTKDLVGNIKYGYVLYILALLCVIRKDELHFLPVMMFSLRALVVITLGLFFLDFTGISTLSDNSLAQFLHNSDNAMIGKTAESLLGYVIFLKASPLVIFLMIYDMKRRKYIWAILSLGAMILSGTRANALTSVAVFVVYILFLEKDKKTKTLFLIFFVAVAVLFVHKIVDKLVELFVLKAGSDSVRSGHLQGIIETWKTNPLSFFTGVGYTAKFYSYGIDAMTYNVELSYWNLLRQLGIFGFAALMAVYIYPMVIQLKRKINMCFILAQLGYIIISYTNPFLFSTTGASMLLLAYYLAYGEEIKKEKSNEMLAGIKDIQG